MYLEVTTIADITSSDGKEIVSRALRGNSHSCEPKRGMTKWPVQAIPDDNTWKLWDKACFSTLCQENRKLYKPLGKWTHIDENWKFRYSHSKERMYQYDEEFWSSHELYGSTRRVQYANPSTKQLKQYQAMRYQLLTYAGYRNPNPKYTSSHIRQKENKAA